MLEFSIMPSLTLCFYTKMMRTNDSSCYVWNDLRLSSTAINATDINKLYSHAADLTKKLEACHFFLSSIYSSLDILLLVICLFDN